jgi:hypothetical protein
MGPIPGSSLPYNTKGSLSIKAPIGHGIELLLTDIKILFPLASVPENWAIELGFHATLTSRAGRDESILDGADDRRLRVLLRMQCRRLKGTRCICKQDG